MDMSLLGIAVAMLFHGTYKYKRVKFGSVSVLYNDVSNKWTTDYRSELFQLTVTSSNACAQGMAPIVVLKELELDTRIILEHQGTRGQATQVKHTNQMNP